jgi:hypothetical protein
MKGLSLEYVAYFVIFVVVIFVGFQIIRSFNKTPEIPAPTYNSTYLCSVLSGNVINFEDFKNILYGFLNSGCVEFEAIVGERLTANDIKNIAKDYDPSLNIIESVECKLPKLNTRIIYVNFKEIKEGEKIQIKRKNTQNSDISICSIS